MPRPTGPLESWPCRGTAPSVARTTPNELDSVSSAALPWRETLSYIVLLPDMVRTALVTGGTGLAERVVAGVEPLAQMHEHALCTARAALTETRGELENAADLYSESAGRWDGSARCPNADTL